MTSATVLKTVHVCPICGDAGHLRPLCVVDGFDVYACATCGAEHAWPMPSAQELKAYYDRPEWFEGGEKGGYTNYDSQTDWSGGLVASVLEGFAPTPERSVLDIGCGYGTHLTAAAQRGWRCFGVELSDHARGVAQQRLGDAAYIVESTADLVAHKFDLIFMLDVLEHLPSPYRTLYELFALGAIGPDTVVVITTPNAGSADARRDPAAWRYRHPPSHLVYYTAEALTYLLKRMRFTDVEVRGLSPVESATGDLSRSGGLVATAKGSDFQTFMQERYVPGTWSKVAAYEHVPRYDLAKTLVAGKTVLDFGCGTGYGAALLAETAAAVSGLDIDESALVWARQTHRAGNLTFRRHDDLGLSLPAASFDRVTCFEMIEHVDHATQKQAVASMARLLRDDGLLLISTPNPEVTKLYGANPYHIREMTEAEFRDLLSPSFPHIQILRQHVRPGVSFSQGESHDALKASSMVAAQDDAAEPPMAFIALCGRTSLPNVADHVFFDDASHYIGDFVGQAEKIQIARTAAYAQGLRARSFETQYRLMSDERNETMAQLHQTLHAKSVVEQQLNVVEHHLNGTVAELEHLKHIRQMELNGVKFLTKQLWRAANARLRATLRRRLLGKAD